MLQMCVVNIRNRAGAYIRHITVYILEIFRAADFND